MPDTMSPWDTLRSSPYLDSPSHCLQLFFALASCFVLSVAVAPSAERKLLMNYGARSSHGPDVAGTAHKQPVGDNGSRENVLHKAVRLLTSIGQVPHALFFTFYTTYIASATFWAVQYFRDGSLLHDWALRQAASTSPSSLASGQVMIAWFLMILQATRRLWECKFVMKPSKSTMWFVHWVLGLAYYCGVSVAIWIEGADAISQHKLQVTGSSGLMADAKLKLGLGLPLFLFGSVMQYRCHQHLANLKKYSLPNLGMFRHIVCPHYTCECLIYLSLAILASPEGYWCNRSLLSVLLFVAVNLGVTAHGTKNWYIEKFGQEKVHDKWTMIPLVF